MATGRWTLHIKGLDRLPKGGYYDLYLTKGGKPVVLCSTFNSNGGEATIRMNAAYDLEPVRQERLGGHTPARPGIQARSGRSEARLGRDAVRRDEGRVRDRHLRGEEVLDRVGVAPDLALRGLGCAQ